MLIGAGHDVSRIGEQSIKRLGATFEIGDRDVQTIVSEVTAALRKRQGQIIEMRLISDPKPDRWLLELLCSSKPRQSGGEREASKTSRKGAAIDFHAAASYFETAAERTDVRTILADWPAQIGLRICLVARKSKT